MVKLTNNKSKPVIDSQHSNKAKLTNQALTSDTVISSKVPGNLNEKYSIPGLFIKPSTKDAPKSVEAKLTLSPVEGTFSLTTKVKDEKVTKVKKLKLKMIVQIKRIFSIQLVNIFLALK